MNELQEQETGDDYSDVDQYPLQWFVRLWPAALQGVTQPLDSQQAAMFSQCAGILDAWQEGKTMTSGVVLYGPPGRGKSAAAAWLAKRAYRRGAKTSYVSCRRANDHLRGLPSRRITDYGDFLRLIDPLVWPFVFLEDLERAAGNPESEQLVRAIIDERSQARCFTVISTNQSPHDAQTEGGIGSLVGDREESRLSRLQWVNFARLRDYRKARS